jgi:hypothetical protein
MRGRRRARRRTPGGGSAANGRSGKDGSREMEVDEVECRGVCISIRGEMMHWCSEGSFPAKRREAAIRRPRKGGRKKNQRFRVRKFLEKWKWACLF